MKPGLWEYKTDLNNSDLLKDALAKIPKAQRAMVKKMMASKMKAMNKPQRQCVTADELKDPETHFKKAQQKNKDMKDCTITPFKSSSKFFHGKFSCPKKNYSVEMKITVENPKKTITKAMVPYPGQANKTVSSIGTWISKCVKKK